MKKQLAELPAKYGSVYTPEPLAVFVARLLRLVMQSTHGRMRAILDPACGDGALLSAAHAVFGDVDLVGVDRDPEAIASVIKPGKYYLEDFLMPNDGRGMASCDYWEKRLRNITAVIANPPWSSDRIYSSEDLKEAGFDFAHGQYDSYVLFIELVLKLLKPGSYYAFIIPDSFFAVQNQALRKKLLTNTQLAIVARLGEKIFPGVFRAATVIVGRNSSPSAESQTTCFRLNTENRERWLAGTKDLMSCFVEDAHTVDQKRFLVNPLTYIDVDTRKEEFPILDKLKAYAGGFASVFKFGRGVEISKSGSVAYCVSCQRAHGYRKRDLGKRWKCKCGVQNVIGEENVGSIVKDRYSKGWKKLFVGESLLRFRIRLYRYIKLAVEGVDYKRPNQFKGLKLLVRKTGLGIYAAVDESGSLTNQTVYILKPIDSKMSLDEIYYYLGIMNSRVVYYYYSKMCGENEWKSHPYLTKDVIFSLPAPAYEKNSHLDRLIARASRGLSSRYNREADLELEDLVMQKFGLEKSERLHVANQLNALPRLGAIEEMRM
ncbi:MAG: N-6 DNA methylase [Bacteroidales bacterium]|nr:N-6 DNA methylase [Bacteroidales bacterium]